MTSGDRALFAGVGGMEGGGVVRRAYRARVARWALARRKGTGMARCRVSGCIHDARPSGKNSPLPLRHLQTLGPMRGMPCEAPPGQRLALLSLQTSCPSGKKPSRGTLGLCPAQRASLESRGPTWPSDPLREEGQKEDGNRPPLGPHSRWKPTSDPRPAGIVLAHRHTKAPLSQQSKLGLAIDQSQARGLARRSSKNAHQGEYIVLLATPHSLILGSTSSTSSGCGCRCHP